MVNREILRQGLFLPFTCVRFRVVVNIACQVDNVRLRFLSTPTATIELFIEQHRRTDQSGRYRLNLPQKD